MRRLGDILIEEKILSSEQLEMAFSTKPREVMLGDWMVQQGLLSTAQLGHALAVQFEVPYVDIDVISVNQQIARLIPEDFARARRAGAFKWTSSRWCRTCGQSCATRSRCRSRSR